eukprot:TRINITY_DN9044_c0_g1_i1.p1 TRINITY_DN9044_c0_g1~~TRINITY_DN9044_c0_g1_i1.p1  ORF type:complete len:704 (+),score=118.47 TRINITY_DN9044_c0_g1_i1:204-2315(+)
MVARCSKFGTDDAGSLFHCVGPGAGDKGDAQSPSVTRTSYSALASVVPIPEVCADRFIPSRATHVAKIAKGGAAEDEPLFGVESGNGVVKPATAEDKAGDRCEAAVSPFCASLAGRLLEVERIAVAEVARLEEAVSKLEAEKTKLQTRPCCSPAEPTASTNSMGFPVVPSCVDAPVTSTTFSRFQYGSHGCDRTKSRQMDMPMSKSTVFVNVESVKQSLRTTKKKPAFMVTDHYHTTGLFQQIARSQWFETVTLIVVCANALWIPLDMDLNVAKFLPDAHWGFQAMENMFCFFFTVETVIRFMSFSHKINTVRDKWLVFDFALVLLMIYETWILSIYLTIFGSKDVPGIFGSVSVFRVFRLLRLARIARIMRAVPELVVLVKGMVVGIRSVCITFALMGATTYVFAIALRQLAEQTSVGSTAFRSVPSSAYTLLIEGVLPDNGELMTTLGNERWYLAVFFFFYIFLTSLTLMNMLVGILCEVVYGVAGSEREEREIDRLTAKLLTILKSIDVNFDGLVSKEEFAGILTNAEAAKALLRVDIDCVMLVDHAETVFEEREVLPFAEFVDVLLQFRSSGSAVIRALVDLKRGWHSRAALIYDRLCHIEEGMLQLQGMGVLNGQRKAFDGASTISESARVSKELPCIPGVVAEEPNAAKGSTDGCEASKPAQCSNCEASKPAQCSNCEVSKPAQCSNCEVLSEPSLS